MKGNPRKQEICQKGITVKGIKKYIRKVEWKEITINGIKSLVELPRQKKNVFFFIYCEQEKSSKSLVIQYFLPLNDGCANGKLSRIRFFHVKEEKINCISHLMCLLR